MVPEDLLATMRDVGVELSLAEARRLIAHVVAAGARDLAPRRAIARAKLAAIEAATSRARPEVVERVLDPADGFVKYLLRCEDGAVHEAVRIPLHARGRYTVCLSSQIGCAMRCDFCATGRLGLSRNLDAAEIVGAFLTVRDDVRAEGGRVSGAVFMGQGEPFHNYDEVIRAARVLCHPCGGQIAAEAITISTVGLVPQIRRYAREGHAYRLIVSLTTTDAEKRARLLPVAGRFSMAELAGAIREYAAVAKGRITLAWVLLGGVNHDAAEVERLQALLGDLPLRINLIDVNDAREDGYRRATDAERKAFLDQLQVLRAPVVRRYSGGSERHAACGMLAATRWDDQYPRPA